MTRRARLILACALVSPLSPLPARLSPPAASRISSAATVDRIIPGGVWISPPNKKRFSGTLRFAARAYPTFPADPPIDHVNFTLSWRGRVNPEGRWLIVCQVRTPRQVGIYRDVYACNWDPRGAPQPIPAGRLSISFDVYDVKGDRNLAPNGVHWVYYAPRP